MLMGLRQFIVFHFHSFKYQFSISGKDELEVAKKVCQFCLVTDSGFRFVLAHFAITPMPAVILREKIWEGLECLMRAGFR